MGESVKRVGWTRTLAFTVCSAAIGGTFQYGYNISIINAPTAHVQSFINASCVRRGAALDPARVTLVWTLAVSVFPLGGLLGSLLAGPMAVRCGRRGALLLNNMFLLLGALLALSCRAAGSFEMLIAARLLVGINAGVSMNVQPMYFGESAPKHLRGAVAFSSAVFTALGILMGQLAGLTAVLGSEERWHYLLSSNALPGLLQLLLLPCCPESPRFLLIDRGDSDACARALARLRSGSTAAEMEELLQEQAQAGDAQAKTIWQLFADRSLRRQLCIVMTASSAMMLCGNDSIYFYASYIFQQAGIPSASIQYVTVGTGACEFLSAVTCNLLIERVGRRPLLAGGYLLMSCWAVVFTVALSLQDAVPGMPYLSMTCVFAYILSFGMGPAGVTGILPAELFQQTERPAAYMIAGSMMWLCLFLVGMAFPFIVAGLGQFCFLPFCGVCVAGCVFISCSLPETKGRTLAEITAEFQKRSGAANGQPRYAEQPQTDPTEHIQM